MRLPYGILTKLEKITGISPSILSEYAATRIRPGSKRALILEDACKQIGLDVSLRLWLFGNSEELKTALTNNGADMYRRPPKKNSFWGKLSKFFSKM